MQRIDSIQNILLDPLLPEGVRASWLRELDSLQASSGTPPSMPDLLQNGKLDC